MKNNLNDITLAIACKESIVKLIEQELKNEYGIKKIINIPPNSGGRTNIKKLKAQLRQCDFIYVIPSQIAHGITDIIYKLNRIKYFDGTLIKIQGNKGKTEILKKIIECASVTA